MIIRDIIEYLESVAPTAYQESYDNAGLIIGNEESVISSALLTLDVTEAVIDEAIAYKCGLIISHHPILFKGIKRINGNTYIERCVIKAVKNNIAIYAAHTNLDSIRIGVNSKIFEKTGIKNTRILAPESGILIKLVTFVPVDYLGRVRDAIFAAGAGHIGNYDQCSYNIEGSGTFRGGENTNPFAGIKGEFHTEKEIRFETILPRHLKDKVVRALLNSHPYEEVAYDLYPLQNEFPAVGAGMIGELVQEEKEADFLSRLMQIFGCKVIRHTAFLNKPIKKVAVCGGTGISLLSRAIAEKADIFVTADIKYHEFFDSENKILIADIGHYESEQYSKEIFHELLIKKFPNFALRLSEIKTSPIMYICK